MGSAESSESMGPHRMPSPDQPLRRVAVSDATPPLPTLSAASQHTAATARDCAEPLAHRPTVRSVSSTANFVDWKPHFAGKRSGHRQADLSVGQLVDRDKELGAKVEHIETRRIGPIIADMQRDRMKGRLVPYEEHTTQQKIEFFRSKMAHLNAQRRACVLQLEELFCNRSALNAADRRQVVQWQLSDKTRNRDRILETMEMSKQVVDGRGGAASRSMRAMIKSKDVMQKAELRKLNEVIDALESEVAQADVAKLPASESPRDRSRRRRR